MRILYIGCVKSSYVFLDALIKAGADIVGVITKESSSFNADFTDITPLCNSNNIPYIYVSNINDKRSSDFIRKTSPDIGFVFGWSQLIKEDIINLFANGIVGYHPAMLPHNRGRHPIIWALVLGLDETASTFFAIDKTADTGDILSQIRVPINYEDDAQSLMDRLLEIGCRQVVELWRGLLSGKVNRIKQTIDSGNSWRKRGFADGQIDWRMSSRSIYNLVRALTKPYVGAHFILTNGDIIKVWKVTEIQDSNDTYQNIEPGKILDVKSNYFVVKAGENLIRVDNCDPVKLNVGDYLPIGAV